MARPPSDSRAHSLPGSRARAEQLHRGLLVARPDDVDARLRLVAVLARQAKWGEARTLLRAARAMDPHAPVDPELVSYIEAQAGS